MQSWLGRASFTVALRFSYASHEQVYVSPRAFSTIRNRHRIEYVKGGAWVSASHSDYSSNIPD